MAHYAKIINGVVDKVIVAEEEFFETFIDTSPGEWIPTQKAALGYIYDVTLDAFYAPQPYPSWVLNKDIYQWEPPVVHPADDKHYEWDEKTESWKEV
jgi:hypothetical protein